MTDWFDRWTMAGKQVVDGKEFFVVIPPTRKKNQDPMYFEDQARAIMAVGILNAFCLEEKQDPVQIEFWK